MRAVTVPRLGPPDVLTAAEIDPPRAAAGQVTIDVAYAGVTFADVMIRRGTVAKPLPVTPGIEVAGRIRDVGAGVEHLSPGQPVAALTIVDLGVYAEVVAVDARLVAPLPGGDDDELLVTMAGAPINTTTAVMALARYGRLATGEILLVHSAASGLGSQLGQVAAAHHPATVIGTVGHPDKVDAALSFGYDTVVLRDEWLADTRAAGRPDVVVDPVGGPARAASLSLLPPDGRLVFIGNASDAEDLHVGTNDLFFTGRIVGGFSLGAISGVHPELSGQALTQAIKLVIEGAVQVGVNTVLPLAEAVDAHRRVESANTTGKTVLRVRP